MTTEDKVFTGSIPEIYETFLVPMIFEPYARDMAERLRQIDAREILEIAAGTGVLTRAMASALVPEAWITATDLNQPMLDLAAKKQGASDRITWMQADGLALPFEDESFDAVTCQFGVMFFPDKVKGFSEAWRVLEPGGRYIFSVWDRIDSNEMIGVVMETLAALFPADPPLFMRRTPHGYHDLEAIGAALKQAGFSSVEAEAVDQIGRAPSALAAATGYCQGNPMRGEIEARAPGELDAVTQRVADVLAERFGGGPIEGRIRALVVTAS